MYYLFERGVQALESIANSIQHPSITDWGIFIATIATVGVGIGSLLIAKRQIEQEGKRRDVEHFERVRPWVIIQEPLLSHVVTIDREVISIDEYNHTPKESKKKLAEIRINFRYVNMGSRVANHLHDINKDSFVPFAKAELQKEKEVDMKIALGPTQSHTKMFITSIENWLNTKEHPIYLGLQISYDNGKGKSMSGAIYKMSTEMTEIITTWYE